MLDWKRFLIKDPGRDVEAEPQDEDERLRVGTCVILLEVAEYDDEFSPAERESIETILKKRFDLSDEETRELIEASARERRESHGLRLFTHQINENYSEDERKKIMEAAWLVIYADDTLNRYEDYFIHRLAKLLRLDHSDLIEAKLAAKAKLKNDSTHPDSSPTPAPAEAKASPLKGRTKIKPKESSHFD